MNHTYLAFALLLASTSSVVFAMDIDPPLTRDEEKLLIEYRKEWKDAGMPAMTAEQEVAVIKNMRDAQVRMMGQVMAIDQSIRSGDLQRRAMERYQESSNAQFQDRSGQRALQESAISKEQLRTAYEALTAGSRFTQFESRGDGFTANGRPFIDIDGSVEQFGADTKTGRVTYFVNIGQDEILVKHHNVNSDTDPILVGRITPRGDQAHFASVSGDTAGGLAVSPIADGVLVVRQSSVVRYTIGQTARAIAIPEGFTVAPLQNGDVAGTGYLLVERVAPATSSVESLGSSVGALFGRRSNTQDYALLNIDSGDVVPLFMSATSNRVGEGVGCERQNDFVNRCAGWRSWDSIWDADGSKNHSHYYWSLSWMQSEHGPIAIAKENNLTEINIIKLQTGERFNAFKRNLGIVSFNPIVAEGGRVSLDARLAFKTHRIEDIGTVIDGSWNHSY